MIDLRKKHALVTGGGSGIGRGICNVLAMAGADVTVADINLNSAKETSENLIGLGKFGFEKVDVTSRASAVDLFERVLATSPRVDILVNNAGVIGARDWWSREEPNDDDWDTVFAVNVKGIATVTDVVSQHMIANNYGKIVNIASIAARQGGAENPPYSASKAAVVSLTQSMALKLAKSGINVNAVCPGLLWTPMSGRQLFEKAVESWIPMQREQTPKDIGNLVAFLVSELSINITGQSINVDGGRFTN